MMGDPLCDPRAKDLLSADPGEVALLATLLGGIAERAQATAAGLRGAQSDMTWQGQAADAFRRTLGKLPGELDNVNHAYSQVAGALNAYEPELAALQSQFRQLAATLQSLRHSAAQAQQNLTAAQDELSGAQQARGAKPNSAAVSCARDAVSRASTALSGLQGEIDQLELQGYRILDSFGQARDHAAGKVSGASGLAPHQSWWDHVLGDVGNWMKDAGGFIVNAAVGIYKGIVDLPSAFVSLVEHPSWDNLIRFAGDVADAATVVLLFTGLGELGAGALFAQDGATAGLLAGANEAADTTATVAGYTEAAAHGYQAEEDALEGRWGAAAGSLLDGGVDAGTTFLGDHGGDLGDHLPGARAAEQAQDTAGALKDYSRGIGGGASYARELLSMDDDDRQLVLESAGLPKGSTLKSLAPAQAHSVLSNLKDPESMLNDAEQSARLSNIRSLPSKTAVNVAQEQASDPAVHAGEHRFEHAVGLHAEG
jgi:uncharacterized protein YukE